MTLGAMTHSAKETQALAGELAAFARPGDLILLCGDLGAGKTAFAQGFGAALGVQDQITSPTFVIMRNHEGRIPLVHMDMYRLEHLQEAVDLGLAEILDDGAVALIEWGDMVAPVLPADFLEIRIERGDGDDDRRITIRAVGGRWTPRMRAMSEVLAPWTAEGV